MESLVEWWKAQLRRIGQRFEDNPNGVQFVQASTLSAAPAPDYIAVSPIASLCTPGVLLNRNTTTGALSWTTQVQNSTTPVTEASAASSLVKLTECAYDIYSISAPVFALNSADSSMVQIRRRIFNVLLTSDGSGNIPATTICPALADYTGHVEVIGVWAAATDAVVNWTFAVTGGTILGPALHTNATTASSVTQFGAAATAQVGCPIWLRGTKATDDNMPITVAAAHYANTSTCWIFGYYWYET